MPNDIGNPSLVTRDEPRQFGIGSICRVVVVLLGILPLTVAAAKVKLPRLISDGMVLQRGVESHVWGWASPGENITVKFMGAAYTAATDSIGHWHVRLVDLRPGGPFTMSVCGEDTVLIHDVLVGDVWVCGGQSNMELPMRRVAPIYPLEIEKSENTWIRQFAVPQTYDFVAPREDLGRGEWMKANPLNVLAFSAVGYFFAKDLFETYHVPIGLINTSLGGAPAEAFMSEEGLQAYPAYLHEAQKFRDSSLVARIIRDDHTRITAWYRTLREKDLGYANPQSSWAVPGLSTDGWSTMSIPGYWADTPMGPVNGVVWFRKTFQVPRAMTGHHGVLNLGRIVDADSVFVNGIFAGTTSYQYPPRWYDIPSDMLREGENTIVVRVISSAGKGGFVPDKPYQLLVEGRTLDLRGEWLFRLGATMDPLASQTFIRWKPLGLYNAMIAPLLKCRIAGVIWYQGEANTRAPEEYRTLFPALIRDWRSHWGEGDFPFLYVQLPNFMEQVREPSESSWAALRDAQRDALCVPNTGMAVTIDIGEWNDIHPLDKKDVGDRLALVARNVAYGDPATVWSGPLYRSMTIEGNRIHLQFTHEGGGLRTGGGEELHEFTIAGSDRRFVWARAKIEGSEVVVWSDNVANPLAVRYAWANNPAGANLTNLQGLPASPFRTDDWPVK
jgi:sialate O-acetylesterase